MAIIEQKNRTLFFPIKNFSLDHTLFVKLESFHNVHKMQVFTFQNELFVHMQRERTANLIFFHLKAILLTKFPLISHKTI